MNLVRVVFLLAVVGILILFTSAFVSAGTTLKSGTPLEENETYSPESLDGISDGFIKTQAVVETIRSGLDGVSGSLQRFEFRLVLLSERLHKYAKEYSFLQPAVDATDLSIEVVDSVVVDLKSDSNTLNNVNNTLDSLNKDIVSLDRKITSFNRRVSSINSTFHSDFKRIENVSRKVNSTFEETNFTKNNFTKNITTDMNKTVKEFGTFFK